MKQVIQKRLNYQSGWQSRISHPKAPDSDHLRDILARIHDPADLKPSPLWFQCFMGVLVRRIKNLL